MSNATNAVNPPPIWMTPEQADAAARGAQHAEDVVEIARNEDRRIDPDDVVTHAPPAFLTADYDPTYRPMAVARDGEFQADAEAHEIAEFMIHSGQWKRCPECGHGIATGLRVHATCEQNTKAGVA